MVSDQSVSISGVTRFLFLATACAVLHSVLSGNVSLFGYAPDVTLVTAAMLGLFGGRNWGLWGGFFLGILMDTLFRSTPFGISSISLLLVGYVMGAVRSGLLHTSFILVPISAVVASALGIVMFVLTATVFGVDGLLRLNTLVLIISVSLQNGILAVAMAPFARWCTNHTDREALRIVRS